MHLRPRIARGVLRPAACRSRRASTIDRDEILRKLVEIQYERNDHEFTRGTFRVRGDIVEVYPSYDDVGLRISLFGDEIDELLSFDPLTGREVRRHERISVYPEVALRRAARAHASRRSSAIKAELTERLAELEGAGRELEAQRLHQRTMFDLEMIKEIGYCHGIENYSRHLSGRLPGEPPPTLLDYLPGRRAHHRRREPPDGAAGPRHVLTAIGRARKCWSSYGFRLPSALDNRPLNFAEWEARVRQVVYVSATPGPYELRQAGGVIVEQIIRPTGLVDPVIDVRPVAGAGRRPAGGDPRRWPRAASACS